MKVFEKITERLLRHQIIQPELAPWLTYALQHFCLTAMGYVLLLFVGYCIAGFMETVFFLFPFVVLRKYIGGWHASSPFKCLLLSAICASVCMGWCYPLFAKEAFAISIILTLATVTIVFIMAPLPPNNLHETKEADIVLKKLSRRTVVLEAMGIITLLSFHLFNLALYVSLGMSCAAVSLLITRLEQKVKMEESSNEYH